jgi:MFS family permease
MIFSAFLFGNYGKKLNKVKIIGYSFILIGILIFSFSFFQKFQFFLLISFLGGFFLAPIMISQDTIIHEEVETSYRGRIFSFREFFVNLLFIIFSLLNGFIFPFNLYF